MDHSFPIDENNNKIDFLETPPLTIKDMGIQENMMGGGNSDLDKKDRLIGEISKAQPKASWKINIPGVKYNIEISLPHKNSITGTLMRGDNAQRQIHIDMFKVSDGLRGHGLGTKLLKSLTTEAKYHGATILNGYITSEAALKTEARVFGKENLKFYNHTTGEKLDLTYEQALKKYPDVNVVVNLNNVDTSNWERPVRDDSLVTLIISKIKKISW